MKNQFTPGPYHVASTGNHQGLVVSEKGGINIAVTYRKEDAPLLASAPELLKALQAMLTCNKELGAISKPVADDARAAIAKATATEMG